MKSTSSSFGKLPRGYWSYPQNQKKFFDELARKLNFTKWEDWYRITRRDVVSEEGGAAILKRHGHSHRKALMIIYPEHAWNFPPLGGWDSEARQRQFFDDIAPQLPINSWKDWYRISHTELIERGGAPLLHHFESHMQAIIQVLREHPFQLVLFEHIPSTYWKQTSNHKEYLDSMERFLEMKTWEEWYGVNPETLLQRVPSFGTLLCRYNTHIAALMQIYPERNWNIVLFEHIPASYWNDPSRHREYLTKLGERIGIETWEDWYQVSAALIKSFGGKGLLSRYNDSHIDTITTVLDHHRWDRSNFVKVGREQWRDIEYQTRFLERLGQKFSVKVWHDWLRITKRDVVNSGGLELLSLYQGDLIKALSACFPQYPWNTENHPKRVGAPSKTQISIFAALQQLFPSDDVHLDLKLTSLLGVKSNFSLDVAVPELKLAFEYQGEQHYQDLTFTGKAQRQRDQRKRDLLKSEGITLIEVPYWRDRLIGSLVATILNVRPELKARMNLRNVVYHESLVIPSHSPAKPNVKEKQHLFIHY
eukprot:TRINITY_DN16765_c0_g1_i1.p1 TRINITY_DN16765_c0_g1~~TRINITY_DN16765_c0_g1_i1.p1  ORF type:complete len:534 (-),score=82.26 TRINITY_DN16765_c0_g1_i1:2-1603(-)